MAEIRHTKGELGQTKLRNVPIAVSTEGFWCCPSPAVFQKNLKPQNNLNKPTSNPPTSKPSFQKKQTSVTENKESPAASKPGPVSDEGKTLASDASIVCQPVVSDSLLQSKIENKPRKVSIEFGEPGTSDLRVILLGKQGFAVKLSVHRSVLVENSIFFANKISEEEQPVFPCIEIDDCDDLEVYVETVGIMYCKQVKQRLMKQSVSRILRILKIAEQLGFILCIESCLEYLEAVPWVGEEEEEKVVTAVLCLQSEGIGVTSILKRVSSDISRPPKDTLSHILELVLRSNEDRSRREMKSTVLKLLKESYKLPGNSGSVAVLNELIYSSCRSCLDLLLCLFRQAADTDFNDNPADFRNPVSKHISLQADNLTWLLEILADRQVADEFAMLWASQQELASLHGKLPIVNRYHVNFVTSRLFVGIGRGELLPSKDTRHMLLQTWLQPLFNDYSWLQHGCRSFDCKVVEEGIGRTILTLPLEDQQSILLNWLGSFLKAGDNCPNLQRAFEVWWRRTFIRPYVESSDLHQSQNLMLSKIADS